MGELLIPVWVLIILLAPIASFVWQFRRVQRGRSSRSKAVVLYATSSLAPVLAYLGVFLLSVSIEELFDTSLVSEGYARSLLIVVLAGAAMVIIGTIAFSIAILFIKDEAT